MAPYKRANRSWLDSDCPREVLAIFDNGGKTFDRYTVLYVPLKGEEWLTYFASSAHPFSPQGFGQHGELTVWDARAYRYRAAQNRESAKWSTLPDDVKRAVMQDVKMFRSNTERN